MENSASDMLALANNIRGNNGFFGDENSGIWFILVLFFLIGGNGYGWNRGGDCASKADLFESANAQNTFSEFRSLQNETTRGFGDVNQHLCNGFAGINQNIAGNFANTNMGIAKGFYDQALAENCGFNSVNQNINSLAAQMAQCCCEMKTSMRDQADSIKGLITANELQTLRGQLNDAKNELLASSLVTSNVLQTNNLENFIRSVLPATPATTA